MFCPKCGTHNDDTNNICYSCGASLDVKGRSKAADSISTNTISSSTEDTPVFTEKPSNTEQGVWIQRRILFFVLSALAIAIYLCIGVALKWRNGGGFVPLMMLVLVLGWLKRSFWDAPKKDK